jgi:hypothetical protein
LAKFLVLKKNKIRKLADHNGYKMVNLTKYKVAKNYFIHRLAAITFIPNPKNKPFVNHINWIKSDNNIENLEWCTQSENMMHAHIIESKVARHIIYNFRVCRKK